jgi:hypothetical protein
MKDVFVNIRMSAELKDQLTAMAKAEQRSLSSQIVFLLSKRTQIEQDQPKKELTRVQATQIPDGVSEQTWADFKRLRAAKKAPVTARALDGIHKEAMKAGISLEAALQMMCARGWAGFNHEWVQSKQDQVAALLKPSLPYLEM